MFQVLEAVWMSWHVYPLASRDALVGPKKAGVPTRIHVMQLSLTFVLLCCPPASCRLRILLSSCLFHLHTHHSTRAAGLHRISRDLCIHQAGPCLGILCFPAFITCGGSASLGQP